MEDWRKVVLLGVIGVSLMTLPAFGQQWNSAPAPLNVSGQIVVAGHSTPYLIRHLPISSFPDLPAELAGLLNRRGCLIPQTYEAVSYTHLQSNAGNRNSAVVLVSTISVQSRPMAAEVASGRRIRGRRTARFSAVSMKATSSGSRIASRLKQ